MLDPNELLTEANTKVENKKKNQAMLTKRVAEHIVATLMRACPTPAEGLNALSLAMASIIVVESNGNKDKAHKGVEVMASVVKEYVDMGVR